MSGRDWARAERAAALLSSIKELHRLEAVALDHRFRARLANFGNTHLANNPDNIRYLLESLSSAKLRFRNFGGILALPRGRLEAAASGNLSEAEEARGCGYGGDFPSRDNSDKSIG